MLKGQILVWVVMLGSVIVITYTIVRLISGSFDNGFLSALLGGLIGGAVTGLVFSRLFKGMDR